MFLLLSTYFTRFFCAILSHFFNFSLLKHHILTSYKWKCDPSASLSQRAEQEEKKPFCESKKKDASFYSYIYTMYEYIRSIYEYIVYII